MPLFDFTLSLPMSSVVSQKFDEEVIVPLSSFPPVEDQPIFNGGNPEPPLKLPLC